MSLSTYLQQRKTNNNRSTPQPSQKHETHPQAPQKAPYSQSPQQFLQSSSPENRSIYSSYSSYSDKIPTNLPVLSGSFSSFLDTQGPSTSSNNLAYSNNVNYTRPHASEIARDGWLWYSPTSSTWSKCYAIATYSDTEPVLQIYNNDQESKPFKVIILQQCSEINASLSSFRSKNDPTASSIPPYTFKLPNKGYEFQFGCDLGDELSRWISALNLLIVDNGKTQPRLSLPVEDDGFGGTINLDEMSDILDKRWNSRNTNHDFGYENFKKFEIKLSPTINDEVVIPASEEETFVDDKAALAVEDDSGVKHFAITDLHDQQKSNNIEIDFSTRESFEEIVDQKLEYVIEKIAQVLDSKTEQMISTLTCKSETLTEAVTDSNGGYGKRFSSPGEIEVLIAELTESMEMRTSKIAKMINQLISESNADKEKMVSLINKSNETNIDLIQTLNASNVKMIQNLTSSPINSNNGNNQVGLKAIELMIDSKLENFGKLIEKRIQTAVEKDKGVEKSISAIFDQKLDSFFKNLVQNLQNGLENSNAQHKLSNDLLTEKFDLISLKLEVYQNQKQNEKLPEKQQKEICIPIADIMLQMDQNKKSTESAMVAMSENLSPKLDSVLEILEFVSKAQSKLVDLMSQKFKEAFRQPEDKKLRQITQILETLVQKVEAGNEQIDQVHESLESNPKTDAADMFRNLIESTSLNTSIGFESINKSLHSLKSDLTENLSFSQTPIKSDIILQRSSSPYDGIVANLGIEKANPLILAMNEKLISLSTLCEQIRDSQGRRMNTIEDKLRQIHQSSNSYVGGADSNEGGEELRALLTELQTSFGGMEEKISRIGREFESNHDVNQGWFNRTHEAVRNIQKQSIELSNRVLKQELIEFQLGESDKVIVGQIEKLAVELKTMKEIVLRVDKNLEENEGLKVQLVEGLQKGNKVQKEFVDLAEGIAKNGISVGNEVIEVKTLTNALCERFSRVECVMENMPDNTSKELNAIKNAVMRNKSLGDDYGDEAAEIVGRQIELSSKIDCVQGTMSLVYEHLVQEDSVKIDKRSLNMVKNAVNNLNRK